MTNTEFYIGWMPKAPAVLSRQLKKVLLVLFLLSVAMGLVLASFQKRFSKASFEFGKLTEVKGFYYNSPVPMLKVLNGKDLWGNASYTTIPLIGYGKHGAETAIMQLEKDNRVSFLNKQLTLKGTLLYNNGITFLQVTKEENAVIKIDEGAALIPELQQKELGVQKLKGEIIDPKCYFGVMKPGEGVAHRDCAIRCILGGIPPVFKVMNEKGGNRFYFLAGMHGEKMNETVKDYVGEPVEIEARAVQQDDWIILYTPGNKIKRIPAISLYRPESQVASCVSSCIK